MKQFLQFCSTGVFFLTYLLICHPASTQITAKRTVSNAVPYAASARVTNGQDEVYRVLLFNSDGTHQHDGVSTVYNQNYSAGIEVSDAEKYVIANENISIHRFSKEWAVEYRPLITFMDTIFLKLHNMQQKVYRLDMSSQNFQAPNIIAFLEDLYLQTKTPMDVRSNRVYEFTVTADPASSGERFRISFMLPISIATPVADLNAEGKRVSIYPNPVSRAGTAFVSFKNLAAGTYSFTLYDGTGRLIVHQQLQHAGGTAVQRIALPPQAGTGIYRAIVRNEKGDRAQVSLLIQ
jgi:hypothetical protein